MQKNKDTLIKLQVLQNNKKSIQDIQIAFKQKQQEQAKTAQKARVR